MGIAQTLNQYYTNIDKSLGGVLPGGYVKSTSVKASEVSPETMRVTNISPTVVVPPKLSPDVLSSPTPSEQAYQDMYNKLNSEQKLMADYNKAIFDMKTAKIEDYAKTHSQELYRAYSGDYGQPWEGTTAGGI